MGNCFGTKTLYPSPTTRPLPPPPIPEKYLSIVTKPCSPLSLDGETYLGYCISVYDGDTVTVNIHSKFGNHQWKVRLTGFDAPELRTKDEEEKKHGKACRDMMIDLISGKFCIVKCGLFEKYGRLLGNIYIREKKGQNNSSHIETESCTEYDITNNQLLDINQWMLDHTPCVVYDGGTKHKIEYNGKYHPQYLKHLEKYKNEG